MIEIKDQNDKVVSRSKNLRGILRMAGKQGVMEITITSTFPKTGQVAARLWVLFYGGFHATADFADFTVCEQWIRRPVFKGAAIHIN